MSSARWTANQPASGASSIASQWRLFNFSARGREVDDGDERSTRSIWEPSDARSKMMADRRALAASNPPALPSPPLPSPRLRRPISNPIRRIVAPHQLNTPSRLPFVRRVRSTRERVREEITKDEEHSALDAAGTIVRFRSDDSSSSASFLSHLPVAVLPSISNSFHFVRLFIEQCGVGTTVREGTSPRCCPIFDER